MPTQREVNPAAFSPHAGCTVAANDAVWADYEAGLDRISALGGVVAVRCERDMDGLRGLPQAPEELMHVVVDASSNIPSPLFRNKAMRTTVAAAILVWAALSSAGAQEGPSTADVPTRFPEVFALWKETLPYAVPLDDWLAKLEGTASPLRDISLEGVQLKFGTVCVPHNCSGNIAGILFTPHHDRVVAMVKLSGSNGAPTTMLIGQMTRPEASCLERLLEDNQLARC